MAEQMRVLIAYDGSDCADGALADLPRAGLPREVEAVVFTVGDLLLPPPSSYEITAQIFASRRATSALAQSHAQASQVIEEAREIADKGREFLRSAFPSWKVRAEVATGSAAWAIIEKAERWLADLVIVGSHGRSALGRLILGSVSQKVASEARTQVRVARCSKEKVVAGGPIRLVLGFDGSAAALAAARAVASRAWPAGSMARVIAVDEQPRATAIAGLMPGAAPPISESAEENLNRLREGIGLVEEDLGAVAGLHVTGEVLPGDPKRVLVEEAERWQADSIFVGSRGLAGRVERFLLGSVSTALVKHAPCSVEIVRA